jgi:4-hydroxy-tetrahydrodipicolinate synthase
MDIDDLQEKLKGISVVLVTPFSRVHGDVDVKVLTQLAGRCGEAGIHTLVALGNTSEVYQLTREERLVVLQSVALARSHAALIAGFTGPLRSLPRHADAAASLGFDAVMVQEPPDPLASRAGIRSFFHEAAELSALPLVLYVRTDRLDSDALLELAANPAVVGIKYAVRHGDPSAATLRSGEDRNCVWVCGLAESAVPAFAMLGIQGLTSGLANVRPDMALGIWNAARGTDALRLRELVQSILPFESLRNSEAGRYNVAVIKSALRWHGMDVGEVRSPCVGLDAAAVEQLSSILASWPAEATRVAATSSWTSVS